MTFKPIETNFVTAANGWYHVDNPLPERFKRGGGHPLATISPDHRLKAWGDDLDLEAQSWNGVSVQFVRRGPNAFQAQLTKEAADKIRHYKPAQVKGHSISELKKKMRANADKQKEAARLDRVSANADEFSKVFGPGDGTAPAVSPITRARYWCYHIYDRDQTRTPLFWAFRSWVNYQEVWDKRKPALEAQVAKELTRAEAWLERWIKFMDWWKSIPRRKEVYNDRYIGMLQGKMADEVRRMQEQIAIAKQHGWRGEVELAGEEIGLEVWAESEDWDDGIIWFRHPETGVLFPYRLLWLHYPEQHSSWKINNYWRANEWALRQTSIDKITQDQAWNWINSYLNKATARPDVDYPLTHKLRTYVGGYKGPNVYFRMCRDQVMRHAATTPCPEVLPE